LLLGVLNVETVIVEFLLDDAIIADDNHGIADLGLYTDVAFHEGLDPLDDRVVADVLRIIVEVNQGGLDVALGLMHHR
jgi:hypothetical protein